MTGHDRFFFFFSPHPVTQDDTDSDTCVLCMHVLRDGVVFCIFKDAKLYCGLEGKCAKVFNFKKILTLGVL